MNCLMKYPELSYQTVVEKAIAAERQRAATRKDRPEIAIRLRNVPRVLGKTESYQLQETTHGYFEVFVKNVSAMGHVGWKLHLSIDAKDVPRAWNELTDFLIESKFYTFKVLKPELIADCNDKEDPQAGKAIVVYFSQYQPDYQFLVEGIERILAKHRIKSGAVVRGDRLISGSKYIYYCNQTGLDGKYMEAEERLKLPLGQQYNPSNLPDPLKNVNIAHVYDKARQEGERTLAACKAWRWEDYEMKVPVSGMTPGEAEKVKQALETLGITKTDYYPYVCQGGLERGYAVRENKKTLVCNMLSHHGKKWDVVKLRDTGVRR